LRYCAAVVSDAGTAPGNGREAIRARGGVSPPARCAEVNAATLALTHGSPRLAYVIPAFSSTTDPLITDALPGSAGKPFDVGTGGTLTGVGVGVPVGDPLPAASTRPTCALVRGLSPENNMKTSTTAATAAMTAPTV
jgi:hypothetical protein